jgi:hypothetical protein
MVVMARFKTKDQLQDSVLLTSDKLDSSDWKSYVEVWQDSGNQNPTHSAYVTVNLNVGGQARKVRCSIYWNLMLSCCGACNVSFSWPVSAVFSSGHAPLIYKLLGKVLNDDWFLNNIIDRRGMFVFTDALFGEGGFKEREVNHFCVYDCMEHWKEMGLFPYGIEQSQARQNVKSENDICTWTVFNCVSEEPSYEG